MGPGGAYPCGACLPCRISKRRTWAHRIELEASMHPHNAFVTLTYDDKLQKDGYEIHSLEPLHLRAFLDALRKRVGYNVFRYFAVGEYGDKNMRPHFHLALFNHPHCRDGDSCRGCKNCLPLRDSWRRGFVTSSELTPGRCEYVAKYTIKKMTRTDDPRLGNRHPEFSRPSLKPGIGYASLDAIAATIRRYSLLTPQGDVPVALRHGSKSKPLGRYLRKKLREKMGLDPRAPQVLSAEASFKNFHSDDQATMRDLQKAAISDPQNPSLKKHVLDASATKRAQIKSRHKLFNRKGQL